MPAAAMDEITVQDNGVGIAPKFLLYQMHISKSIETPELIAAIASLLRVWRS